jgi:hypothetical protein
MMKPVVGPKNGTSGVPPTTAKACDAKGRAGRDRSSGILSQRSDPPIIP